MDKEQARAAATRAEALADDIEMPAHAPGLPERIAALLLFGMDHSVHDGKAASAVIDGSGHLVAVPKPWGGKSRGLLSPVFMTDESTVFRLVEHVFPGWGYDIMRWDDAMVASAALSGAATVSPTEDTNAPKRALFDAEVSPPGIPLNGNVLVGQHTTAAGALLAAALRGYAFKVKHEANAHEMPNMGVTADGVNLALSDQDRGWVHDIAERAADIGLITDADRMAYMNDIAAAHLNGCPLQLEQWLHATTDQAFAQDLVGIRRNINRRTGKLDNGFVPRCAAPVVVGVDMGAPGGDATAEVVGTVEDGKFHVLDARNIEKEEG